MEIFKLLRTITCCFLISYSPIVAQYGGMGYYPYAYGGGMYGTGCGGGGYPCAGGGYPGGGGYPASVGYPGGGYTGRGHSGSGYPAYGYYPQYPIFGGRAAIPCFISILCGGSYPSYSGYPYYRNSMSTAFASSSNSVATAYASTGGFFG